MAQNARVSLHGQLAAAGIAQTQEAIRDLRDQADKVQRLQAVIERSGDVADVQLYSEPDGGGSDRLYSSSVSRRPVSMKSFLVFLLIAAAAPVLARYEEEYGSDGPGQIADINLLWYMLIGVGIWAVMVWELACVAVCLHSGHGCVDVLAWTRWPGDAADGILRGGDGVRDMAALAQVGSG